MIRDLARLANDAFDAVVIGGGVYGLAIARELAARGVGVALVERGDFGGATSFNSLKTVHGGIRALQHGAVSDMRQFVRERRGVARIAPHLVRVLPFVVPTYRHPLRNRGVMRVFLAAYDRLAADRNDGVDPGRRLPPSRTIPREECLRLNPFIDPAGVTGGALWHDYQLQAPERFALALLQSAVADGAAAANYADVTALLRHGRVVQGVRVRDQLGGAEMDVRARVVVNAAGPWAWPLLERLGVIPRSIRAPALSLALNIVVDRPLASQAAGGLVGGRYLFLVPWRDRSILGTSHERIAGAPDGATVTGARVAAFLTEAAAAFPEADLRSDNVRLVHRGLLPAPASGSDPGALLKHSIVHDHAADGVDNLITVLGVRYTTARATAAAAAVAVAQRLGRPPGSRSPVERPLVGGDIPDVERFERQEVDATALPAPLLRRLIAAYGTTHRAVVQRFLETPALGAQLSAGCRVTRAEILHAVREEMAVRLSDALLRRTEAGTGGHPGAEAVRAAADVMAPDLGWTPSQTGEEIAAVDAFYRIPTS
jgi:glycerol-3-phosphate dehydrogenase